MGRLLPVIFIFLCALSSFLATNEGLSIKIIRRDKVDTNLFPKNLSDIERYQVFSDLSLSRALYLKERAIKWANSVSPSFNQSAGIATISPKLKQIANSMFLVPITIGSNRYRAHLQLDTGSDFTWVLCKGCKQCFHIDDGPFDSKASGSYRALLKSNPACRRPEPPLQGTCIFEEEYQDDTKVSGNVSRDNVHFTTRAGSTETVRELMFGCGVSASPDMFAERGSDNPTAGIFAIGEGERGDSFMVLQEHITKSKFSYCLPPWNSLNIETNLLFGDDIQPLPESAITIPMATKPYYMVSIEAITVGMKRLDLGRQNPLARRLTLDTGSSITSLVDSVHHQVFQDFTQILSSYMKPVINLMESSKLCYDSSILKKSPLPSLTFHFNDRKQLTIDFRNVFKEINLRGGRKLACMMIQQSPAGVENVMGAFSMADYRFVHNLRGHSLSFYEETCGRN